jgi:4-hydroxybenzoate polyprenyltransferase
LGSGKRLRDLSYIKILLIGAVWSWITIGLPLLMYQEQNSLTLLLSLERFLFFIAITIPFDIRDQEIDKQSEVKTLIHLWGSRRSLNICYLLLTVCAGIAITCYISELIQVELLISLLLTYGFTGLCIFISTGKTHDYYYSGLLDGTMFLPLLFYMLIGVLA